MTAQRKRSALPAWTLLAGACVLAAGAATPSGAEPRLGINLAGPADWNTELPFADVFRLSRPWISQEKGKRWGKGPPLALDAHGWVRRLAPNCWAETLLCTIPGGHYPAGRYRVFYRGKGRIEFGGAAAVLQRAPGRILLEVHPERGPIFLRLTQTDPADYLRDIRVFLPGLGNGPARPLFRPGFLKLWRGIACFRFMDWMKTNGSPIEHWSQRPTLEDATWTRRGIPVEVMVDLCNRLKADAWFCIPHRADDEYVRRFAALVRDRLDPERKVWIEYSNEVWNSRFAQARYARKKAAELGLGPKQRPWEGGGIYYARRSVEIFRIWSNVFGTDRRRLRRVIAWQAGNVWWLEHILFKQPGVKETADVVAIAPYFHFVIRPHSSGARGLSAAVVDKWPVSRLMDAVESQCLPAAIQAMKKTARFARTHGLELAAYEGGQHLVGAGGAENDAALTRLFQQANAGPRMGKAYRAYLAAWSRAGGGLFCHFSSVSRWSKWGSWGLLQYMDEPPAHSPKFLAVMNWARSLGQNVRVPKPREPGDPSRKRRPPAPAARAKMLGPGR